MAQIPMGNAGRAVAGAVPMLQQRDETGASARATEGLLSTAQQVNNQATADNTRLAEEERRRQEAVAEAAGRARDAVQLQNTEDALTDLHDEVGGQVLRGEIPKNQARTVLAERAKKITDEALPQFREQTRALVQPRLNGTAIRLDNALRRTVEQKDRQDVTADMGQRLESLSRKYAADPAAAEKEAMATFDTLGPFSTMNAAQLASARQKWKEESLATSLETHATEALLREDLPALAKIQERIQGDEGEPLDPGKRNALALRVRGFENQVRADQQRRVSEGRFDIASRTKDVQSMTLSGVTIPDGVAPTVDDYTKLHGASGPAMWQQEVGNYLQIGGAIQQLKVASAEERAQIARQQEPVAGAGFAGGMQMREAVLQANKIIESQIVADPAAYAMQNSPRVQQYARAIQLVGASDFGGNLDAKAKAMREAVDSFAAVANAEQLRLGVDTIRDERTGNKLRGPKLLTNQQANAISDQFHDQSMGGAKAAVLVQALEAQWGKYWPQVYGQLANDNKLPPAALVIPNMPNDGSRARMAAASVMKMDDLKALIDPADPKDIREKLLSQFGNAQPTFVAQGADGNRTLAVVMGEAEKLALMYRSQGKSVGDATKQAFTETMGHRYEFADTYRVPKTEMPKDVQAGAAHALRGIKPEDVQVFAGPTPTILTDDALRNRSMWITRGDESGLQLMLRGADGGVYAVQGKDGRPVSLDWAALRQMAVVSRNPVVERQIDIEELRRRQQELNPRR